MKTKPMVQNLQKVLDRRSYQTGEVIFDEGSVAKTAFIIRKGSVNIVKRSITGGQVILTTLVANQAFGELALLDNTPRSASAVAAEPTELLVIPAEKFLSRMDAMDPFMRNWFMVLKHRILDLSSRIADQET
jgi:CRP-like cAMP-binding protein